MDGKKLEWLDVVEMTPASNGKVEAGENVEAAVVEAPPDGKVKRFFKKYFCQGQTLSEEQEEALKNYDPNAPFHERFLIKHRRLMGFIIPILFWQAIWWTLAITHNYFANFPTHYPMTITMAFGSFIGGATAEGGGAVAFPVMTLVLHLSPAVARDFSFMIQCCGTASGGFCIIFMKIKVEWHSILFCTVGSLVGLIFGLEVVDPVLDPHDKKLIFVSVWFSFCMALFLLNRQHKRKTFDTIQDFCFWKGLTLFLSGFIGGIFTAMTGSGTCIASFSVLCLLFRVSEKIATPTSVILMSINTFTGVFWRQFVMGGAEVEAWKYLSVALPTACVAGPLGALLASHCHRLVYATTCYLLDTAALITALCVIPMSWQHWVMVVGLIIGGSSIFNIFSFFGQRMLRHEEEKERKLEEERVAHMQNSLQQGYDNLTITAE